MSEYQKHIIESFTKLKEANIKILQLDHKKMSHEDIKFLENGISNANKRINAAKRILQQKNKLVDDKTIGGKKDGKLF